MSPIIYFCCFFPLIIALIIQKKHEKFILRKIIKSKWEKSGGTRMVELIKKYIGKDCIIYTMDTPLKGVIKEIRDGWVLVDIKGKESIVNLDFVTRIIELPNSKKSKNKKDILD